MPDLADFTVKEYLPSVKRIYASLEVQLANYDGMDERPMLRMAYLEKELGLSSMVHATHLISVWLKGLPFKLNPYIFEKTDACVKWSDMMLVLREKIIEHDNERSITTLSLSRSGRIIREAAGSMLSHDFEEDGFSTKLLMILAHANSYIKTETLRQELGSRSAAAVSKLVESINAVTRSKLRLPAKKRLIESKRGSGYRIDPCYTLLAEK